MEEGIIFWSSYPDGLCTGTVILHSFRHRFSRCLGWCSFATTTPFLVRKTHRQFTSSMCYGIHSLVWLPIIINSLNSCHPLSCSLLIDLFAMPILLTVTPLVLGTIWHRRSRPDFWDHCLWRIERQSQPLAILTSMSDSAPLPCRRPLRSTIHSVVRSHIAGHAPSL